MMNILKARDVAELAHEHSPDEVAEARQSLLASAERNKDRRRAAEDISWQLRWSALQPVPASSACDGCAELKVESPAYFSNEFNMAGSCR